MIYYLCDIVHVFSSSDLFVFVIDQNNYYHLHHIMFNEKDLVENNEYIEIKHCCCCYGVTEENKSMHSKLISCSHSLSFINMSCEIEQENKMNTTNMYLVNLDHYLINLG